MTDLLLQRLTAPAAVGSGYVHPGDIKFPDGLAPKPLDVTSMPKADVVVMTYTYAEKQALADVLSPGCASRDWNRYTTNWSAYESQLTGRSPAREAKCLGTWKAVQIGSKTVVLFGSELHLSTDATSLPVAQLVQQLVEEVEPKLFITSGTAGGIGTDTSLGDVTITNGARFNCQKAFKNEPYANATYIDKDGWTPGTHVQRLEPMLAATIGDRLAPVATHAPKVYQVLGEPGVETMDFFGFSATGDPYGVVKDDSSAKTEEMDDACIPLAMAGLADQYRPAPSWLSIRNASDPQMSGSSLAEMKKQAETWYEHYGYWTTVASALTNWAVIADL